MPDSRINASKSSKFIKNFSILFEGDNKGKKFKDAVKHSLYFIYLVRNNIFHGSKTIFNMMEPGQGRRLEIYTSLLLSIIELFFEAISKKNNWNSKEIDDNIKKYNNRTINKLTNLKTLSLSSKFNVEVPDGILFYPCCGDDTDNPIRLFLDCISEFHFVDSRMIPSLPNLEFKEIQKQEHISHKKHITISKKIIKGIIEHDNYESLVDENILKSLNQKNIKPTDYRNELTKIYKQTWIRTENSKENVEMIRYIQDGIITFMSLPNISVFFYVGDSHGEGGSGQWWLGPEIFNLILDKLVDGGIIVTDGSNPDPMHLDVEWKSLWKNAHDNSNNLRANPDGFTYYNRNFNFLGQCGHRHGPVYAWKVSHI